MEFKLVPVTREYYDNEVRISHRRRKKKVLKHDELEIEYYRKIGIDIKPIIQGS
jgi:hypothetical protein